MKLPVTNRKYRKNYEDRNDSKFSNEISNSNMDYIHSKDTTLRQA